MCQEWHCTDRIPRNAEVRVTTGFQSVRETAQSGTERCQLRKASCKEAWSTSFAFPVNL